jgi:hypothetical protein
MAWTDTSNTCVAVWGSMVQLKQIDEDTQFDDTGSITMNHLLFYQDTASPAVNNAKRSL